MQQYVRFLIDVEDNLKIEREAQKLGLRSSDFLKLLIKLYFNGLKLEPRKLVHNLEGQK